MYTITIMDSTTDVTCYGCLNIGRRMIEITEVDLRMFFAEIINENLVSSYSRQPLQLCFECTALLIKFNKFKKQVATCFGTLHNGTLHNYHKSTTKPFVRLKPKHQANIDIPSAEPPQSDAVEITVECVKVEHDTENDTSCHIYDDTLDTGDVKGEPSHEYEIPLTKIKKKKKKPNGKVAKTDKERGLEFTEVTLSAREIEQERATLALRDDYVNAMFTCDKCILTFPNEDDLNDHLQVKHIENACKYKCQICTCSFSSEVSYNYHTNKHTRRYQCVACSDRFANKRAATKHYNFAHCLGTAIDYENHKEYIDNTDATIDNNIDSAPTDHSTIKYAEHNETSAQEGNSFPCEFCAKMFKWKTSLRKHLEKHRIETGQKRKPYCAPCRLSFTTTPNLQKHVRTSSNHKIQLKLRKLNENETEGTQKHTKQKSKLMDEIRSSVTSAQPQYCCPQCDKVFLWRGNLLRHLHSHAAKANGDLVCKPCDRTFSSIATYQQHMRISRKHVSEHDFKYMCSDCGRRFPTKSHLRDHINWEHLKNFVYTCDHCQKVFKTSNSVYLHKQAVHNKDSVEHLCDHCGKAFPNNAKLRNHILGIHSGGAVHRCAWCDARFSWQSCLSRHVRQKHGKQDKTSEQ